MAINPIGSRLDGPDGDLLGPGRPIVLSDWRSPSTAARNADARLDGARCEIYPVGMQFTPADRAALTAWAGNTGHGYGRLSVDRGLLEDDIWASYALVYLPGQAWSVWGVTRRSGQVEVWRCATGETVGRHARMVDALASLPHASQSRRALPAGAANGPERETACGGTEPRKRGAAKAGPGAGLR